MTWGLIAIGSIIGILSLVVNARRQNEITEMINLEDKVQGFYPTEKVVTDHGMTRYIEVDTKNKRWRINQSEAVDVPIFNYEDLREFELLEKSRGSTSTAHTAPSMMGVALGTNATKTYINTKEYAEILIRVSFKNLSIPDQYIDFGSHDRASFAYSTALGNSQRCLSLLRKIQAYNEDNSIANSVQNTVNTSVADELFKLKSLLDEGLITQEEFETQKQKLLQ